MEVKKKFRVLLVSISLLLQLCIAATPRSAEYRVRETSVFGVQVKMAQIDVDMGQEVYIGRSDNCASFDCDAVTQPTQPECICDYSKHTGCGMKPGGCTGTCAPGNRGQLCSGDNDWIEVNLDDENGTTVHITEVESNSFYQIRWQVTDPCSMISIRLVNRLHQIAIKWILFYPESPGGVPIQFAWEPHLHEFASPAEETFTGYVIQRHPDTPTLTICPDDPRFQLGTYVLEYFVMDTSGSGYLFTYPLQVDADITISLLPMPTTPLTSQTCTPESGVPCLQNGERKIVQCTPSLKRDRFKYTFEGCQSVALSFQPTDDWAWMSNGAPDGFGLAHQATMSVHKVDGASGSFNWDKFEWVSTWYDKMKAEIRLSFCPADSTAKTTLYIQLDHPKCPSIGSGVLEATILVTSEPYSAIENQDESYQKLKLYALADLPVYEAPDSSYSAVQVRLPSGEVLSCDEIQGERCHEFFPAHPEYVQPYFPVVGSAEWTLELNAFSSYKALTTGYDPRIILPQFKQNARNTYTMLVVLAYQYDSRWVVAHNEEDLEGATITFNNVLRTSTGEPFTGSVTLHRAEDTPCDLAAFQDMQTKIYNKINEIDNATWDETAKIVYEANSMLWLPTITNCKEKLSDLLGLEFADVAHLSTECTGNEPASDPCCNPRAAWSHLCKPREVTSPAMVSNTEKATDPSSVCSSGACISSFLDDYRSYMSQECANFDAEFTKTIDQTIVLYWNCLEKAYGTYYASFPNTPEDSLLPPLECYTDSDCAEYNTTCNLRWQRCQVTQEWQDNTFIDCIFDSLDTRQQMVLMEQYDISGRDDPQLYSKFKEQNAYPRCSNLDGQMGIPVRHQPSTSLIYWEIQSVADSDCPDATQAKRCQFMRHQRSSFVAPSVTFIMPESSCIANSNGSEVLENNNCPLWNSITSLNTKGWCHSKVACNYDFAAEYGNTTDPVNATEICGWDNACMVCDTERDCTILDDVDEADCNVPVCVRPQIDRSLAYSEVFLNVSPEDCLDDQYARCSQYCDPETLEECTKEECLQPGRGICVGQEPLTDVPFPEDARDYGACALPKTNHPKWVTGCKINQITYRNSCLDYDIKTPAACAATNGQWLVPATTEAECLAWEGCWERVPTTTELGGPFEWANQRNYIWSPKSKEDCLAITNPKYAEWRKFFKWKPARWVKATPRQAEWKQKEGIQKFIWTEDAFAPWFVTGDKSLGGGDYTSSLLGRVFANQLSIKAKSEFMCHHSTPLSITDVVCCDCFADNDHQCFHDDLSFPQGQLNPCEGFPARSGIPVGYVETSATSVTGCGTIFMSAISADNYKSYPERRLSSNFAPFVPIPEYSVLNDNNAAVGTIVGDGMRVEVSGQFSHITVCLTSRSYEELAEDDHVVHDVAELVDGELRPMNLQSTCATITNPKASSIYFPIHRVEEWETAEEKYYDTGVVVMMYILAVLFLLTAAFALSMFIQNAVQKKEFNPDYFFTFLFTIVRSIHFFLLPTGFDVPTADYVLVVLPTFFYFTAFTTVVTMWVLLTTAQLSNLHSKFRKLSFRAKVIVNVVLYALFIVIVFIFEFNPPEQPETCGLRIIEPIDDEVRFAVSILYAVVIAAVSLIFGLAFLIFGMKLYRQLSAHAKTSANTKVLILSSTYSAAFLLHTIFIIVLISLPEPIMVFTFLGLLITEIAPSVFMMSFQLIIATKKKITRITSSSDMGTTTTDTATTSSTATSTLSSEIPMSDMSATDTTTQSDY